MGENCGCIMGIPPMFSTVRVNLMKKSIDEAKSVVQTMIAKDSRNDVYGCPVVQVFDACPDLLVIPGSGPHSWIPYALEIYVDRRCGNAIIRGSELYACGILGSSRSFVSGEFCSVWMDVERKCLKGWCKEFIGVKIFIGNGLLRVGRTDVFNTKNSAPKGVGVEIIEPVWRHTSLNRSFGDWGFAQNLPSVLCGHILGCRAGEKILDMCAAPGGKSTHIAQLMSDIGSVICLDQNLSRLKLLRESSEAIGLSSIQIFHFDATKALDKEGKKQHNTPPFSPETFDRILVDAPCSGLGQRPLPVPFADNQMRSFPVLQRKILTNAVYLLKRGGTLLYSTCTLIEEENECQVRWLLDRFSDIRLVQQEPRLELPVTSSSFLSADESVLVQKFDPRVYCKQHSDGMCLVESKRSVEKLYNWSPRCNPNTATEVCQDTNGFFLAKFEKDYR